MAGFGFRKNTVFKWDGAEYKIDRLNGEEQVGLERIHDGAISVVTRQEILQGYANGLVSLSIQGSDQQSPKLFSRPLADLSEPMAREYTRRQHYLKAILKDGKPVFTNHYLKPLIQAAAALLEDTHPPSVTTIYRWYSRTRSSRDPRALIPRMDRRGSSKPRQDERVLALLSEAVEDAFKASPQSTVTTIYYRLIGKIEFENRSRFNNEQLKAPSLRSTYRLLDRVEAYEMTAMSEGKASADRRFRLAKYSVKTTDILERVEIDHTPLDMFVIDEKTNESCGRPTLTVAIDHFSRMLLGYHISFNNPSTASLIGALRHAILPKVPLAPMKDIAIENQWICYGLPDLLVVDNGMEFHSNDLDSVAFDLGMKILYCPKHQPRFKGAVERFLKTANYYFAHQLPGTSFARMHMRGDYNSEKSAILTLAPFSYMFEKWALDIYAKSPHKTIQTTPWAKWNEGLKRKTPDLPDNIQVLKSRIGKVCERKLRQDGILLDKIRYNSDALAPLIRKFGPGVLVRIVFDPEDLSEIQVWGPGDDSPISVLALDQSYAGGLTQRQHKEIQKVVVAAGASMEDKAAVAKGRYALSQKIDQLLQSKKVRTRRTGAALIGESNTRKEPIFKSTNFPTQAKLKDDESKPLSKKENLPLPSILESFQLTKPLAKTDLAKARTHPPPRRPNDVSTLLASKTSGLKNDND